MTTEPSTPAGLHADMRDDPTASTMGQGDEPPKKAGGLKLFLILLLFATIGAVGAYFYLGDEIGEDVVTAADKIMVIRADETPIKTRPADPGGMSIPDRDKLVYNRLKGENAPDNVERLLPGPEQPQSPPQPDVGPDAEAPKPQTTMPEPLVSEDVAPEAPISNQSKAAKAPAEAPPPPAAPQQDELAAKIEEVLRESSKEPGASEPTPGPSGASSAPKPDTATPPPPNAPAVPPVEDVAAIKPPPAIPELTAPDAQTSANRYQVQLVAARSEERANAAWAGFVKKHSDLLGGLRPSIIRADLGDRGVYYRLRAGPLADEARAKELCAALKARSVDCLVKETGQ